jgi:single-strand DNA-binding protein
MSLPTMSGTGRLTAEPELRFTPAGMAVCKLRFAFNSRKKNDAGEWVDGDVFYIDGTVFKDEAEHVSESLTKGAEVVVTGRIKTRKYTDKDGNPRSINELMVDSVGPSLKYASAKVAKMQRSNGNTAEDAWANASPVKTNNFDDEPPF